MPMSVVINSTNECERCKKEEAEVFNILGSFCLECWQDITYPFLDE